jgi:RNA polymerase sigma-70 factor, ECF subfamily
MTSGVPIDPRIAKAAAGDRKAAHALLAEVLPRMRNLIRYLIRGDREVDDIAQQALIAVMKGLPSYRGEGRFESWVDRVTVRETFAELRRNRKERDSRAVLFDVDAIPSEERATFLERREAVERLETLPDDQRTAIVLHHVVGMSVPEVAEATGVSFDTAKSRIRLAMGKLRRDFLEEEKIA